MNANRIRLAACLFLLMSSHGWATSNNSNTDWFKDAKYGVFMHFLPGGAAGLARVGDFDVDYLANQLETMGAKYFVVTLGQNSGYFNSPNAAYDRITGYAPGERCSTRDLPMDLYRALAPKGIRLMLYLPCQVPNGEDRAQKAFGLPQGRQDQPIDAEFARKWAAVIQEWSDRYGDKVVGWWFDGGYKWIQFNEEIGQIYAAAVKHGNPNAIVTFNPGVSLIRHTQAEDYTAGELNEPFDKLPTSRWVDGSQWHALTFIGSQWGRRDTRYPAEKWAQWVSEATSKGGVVTLDMGPNWDPQAGPIGSLAQAQVDQVVAIRDAVRGGEGESTNDDRANPSRSAVELQIRDGLPNFFAKAQTGGKLTVAYFGGSITAAEGWRPQTTAWLKQQYPKAQFVEVNAAIGGTGSDLGVYRLGCDVLSQKPDLVFVEFAVNDGGASPEQIYRCMEGIVRQIRRADPSTEICFVYTMHEGMLKDLAAGRLPRSASAMEFIADHYGIPSILLAKEAARRINAGEWVFTSPKPEAPADPAQGLPARPAFSGDSCHPFAETGHKLYTEAIIRSFDAMEKVGTSGARSLPTPFTPDNHEAAKLIPLTAAMVDEGWVRLDPRIDSIARNFSNRLPILWRADKPGATLSFAFHGRAAAIYDLLGPDGGELEVLVDGQPARPVRRFDAYCTYHRLGTTNLLTETEAADHTVTVRLTANRFDKAEILSHNQNKIDDPTRYEPLRWYAGALLIDGELKPSVAAQSPTYPKRLARAESFLGIHFDFHAGPDCNAIGKNTTREMIENVITQVRPDYIQIDCKGHPGLSSYPTNVGNRAPGFVGDPLRLWRQVTAEQGVALYMHYSGVWDSEAIRQHSDWGVVNADGKTNENATSRFGPYADKLLIPQLRELAGDYGVDGVWADGECWASVPDYSEAALKAFRETTGITDIPRKPDDPHWFEFLQFHREVFRKYLRYYIAEVKRTNPDFQMCSNWAFTDHMPEAVSAPVDFLSGDYNPNDSVNSARLSGRYLTRQGVPWDLMAWSFSSNKKTADGRNQKTAVQLEREAAVVLALGGGFQAYFTQKRDGSIREERGPVMAEVGRFCRARQALCHHAVQVPQVAVLFSTAAHYRKNNGLFQRDLARINGVLQALLESQQSVEIQSEHHLTGRMAEYPLIVVPEWEYLEAEFKTELIAYVRGGGNLLLIGPKTAALFQDELDVTWDGEPGPATDCQLAYQGDLAAIRGQVQGVTLGAECEPFGEIQKGEKALQPAAFVQECGQGRIAATCFTFGQGYADTRNSLMRRFLNDLSRQLFPKPMVEVKGSNDVDVVVNRQNGKLMVNLVNTAGPHQSEPVLDSIPPVGPLDVTIRQAVKPAKVVLEPVGTVLPFEYRDGEVRLTVPRVEIHEIIVVDND